MGEPSWNRRAVLQGLSAVAGAGLLAPPAGAQEVKYSSGTERPKLKAPANACDCHHHIYGAAYKVDPRSTLRPPPATVEDYRALQRRLGLTRNVVVQPSTYGVENPPTLDALIAFGPTARAFVVVDITVIDAELGWHIEINAPAATIMQLMPILENVPSPIVFDHLAHIPQPAGAADPLFAKVIALIDKGRTWVKLSGAYADSKIGPPSYADATRVAQAYVKAAPERLVWGSDWPHPGVRDPQPKPDDALLFDLLLEWAPDEAVRNRILVDNPARLYDFPI